MSIEQSAPSIRDLADRACQMPWDKPGDIGWTAARREFRNAIEPEMFLAMLHALQGVVRVADRATVEFDAARDAIAKATAPLPGTAA